MVNAWVATTVVANELRGSLMAATMSAAVPASSPGKNWKSSLPDTRGPMEAMSGGNTPDGPGTELQEIFEERLRRPMGSPLMKRYAAGLDAAVNGREPMGFEVDAEGFVRRVDSSGNLIVSLDKDVDGTVFDPPQPLMPHEPGNFEKI